MRIPCNCYIRGCRWLLGVIILDPDVEESNLIDFCLAFPEGIPDDIAYGDDKHESVRKGQVGQFVYEKG